jgi:serine/threonine protein kinase
MTDKKDIEKKISSVIDSLKDMDTIELKGQINDENQLFDYSNLLSNISDNPEMAIGADIGHWQIKKLIGKGGMSIVYLVERNDDQLNQQAALKIIPNGLANKSMIDRFVRERQILSDLHHPNIAQLYDAGVTDQGLPWFVMEYIQGEDIIGYAQNNLLNIDQRIYLIKQVCDALAYAHAHGVVHRDIKPNNLLVDSDKNIKLLDFGIASSKEQQSLTMTGAIIGTPGYMSPEQAKGLSSEIDRRSDIFSLGVLMYKLIKHEMPFEAESISEISYKIIHDEPTLLGSQVPIELQAITFKCLEKKVENRYSSVKRLQKDLDAYLNGDVVSARKVTLIGRFFKKVKKHPIYSSFIFVAIISTIIGISYGIYQSFESIRKLQVSEKYLAKTQELKAKIRRSHMMPLHDIESDYLVVEKEIKKLREDIENSDIDDSGLSYFALGEAYFNMKGFTKALEYFQKAEEKG